MSMKRFRFNAKNRRFAERDMSESIDGRSAFLAKSEIEIVALCRQNARYRGALSLVLAVAIARGDMIVRGQRYE